MGKIEQISLFKISKFWFFKSALLLLDQFWADILHVCKFFCAKSIQKTHSRLDIKIDTGLWSILAQDNFQFSKLSNFRADLFEILDYQTIRP